MHIYPVTVKKTKIMKKSWGMAQKSTFAKKLLFNGQASFLGCDILMDPDRIPIMVKDYYWDKQNMPIPYTEASMHFKKKTYKGSADDMM